VRLAPSMAATMRPAKSSVVSLTISGAVTLCRRYTVGCSA
jgi:hypothetical protein